MKTNKVYLFVLICSFLIFFDTFSADAQGSAGSTPVYESRYAVELPTAGVIPKNSYSAYLMFFEQGGALFAFDVSPLTNFSIGVSYSGTGIIGLGTIIGQGLPGVQARFRIVNETFNFPAILIGWDNQGRGKYDFGKKRFRTLSPGFFASASKNFKWSLGNLALHGGVTYSIEQKPSKRMVNCYAGAEQSIYKSLAVNVEFNPGFDDIDELKRYALLDAAIRWSFIQNFTLEFKLTDILRSRKDTDEISRSFGIEFVHPF